MRACRGSEGGKDHKDGVLISLLIMVFLVPTISSYFVRTTNDLEQVETIMNLQLIILPICIVFTIIFLVLSVSMYYIERRDKNKEHFPIENAKKILYERYAKGEINRQEFEQMKNDIDVEG